MCTHYHLHIIYYPISQRKQYKVMIFMVAAHTIIEYNYRVYNYCPYCICVSKEFHQLCFMLSRNR